ncbi:MAG: hypothetical protein AB7K68_00140 [Bacteriovoracia bacterium]
MRFSRCDFYSNSTSVKFVTSMQKHILLMLPALVTLSVGMASPNAAFSASKQKKESLPVAACPDTQSLSGKFPNYFWKVKEPTPDSALTESATLSPKGASYGAKVKFPKSWKVVPSDEEEEYPDNTLNLMPVTDACKVAGKPGSEVGGEWCSKIIIRVRPNKEGDWSKYTGKEPNVDHVELGVRYRRIPFAFGENSMLSGIQFSVRALIQSFPDTCMFQHEAVSISGGLRMVVVSTNVVKASPGVLSKHDGQTASEAAAIINSIQFIR